MPIFCYHNSFSTERSQNKTHLNSSQALTNRVSFKTQVEAHVIENLAMFRGQELTNNGVIT